MALLGAAAVLVVQVEFRVVDTAVLSNSPPPIKVCLAGMYAGMLVDGAKTIATRVTLFREAVLWLLASLAVLLIIVVVK